MEDIKTEIGAQRRSRDPDFSLISSHPSQRIFCLLYCRREEFTLARNNVKVINCQAARASREQLNVGRNFSPSHSRYLNHSVLASLNIHASPVSVRLLSRVFLLHWKFMLFIRICMRAREKQNSRNLDSIFAILQVPSRARCLDSIFSSSSSAFTPPLEAPKINR